MPYDIDNLDKYTVVIVGNRSWRHTPRAIFRSWVEAREFCRELDRLSGDVFRWQLLPMDVWRAMYAQYNQDAHPSPVGAN